MFYLVVQTVLLVAVAFILGAIVGCLLRRLVGTPVGGTARDGRDVVAVEAAAAPAATARGAPHRPQPRLVPQPLGQVEAGAGAAPAVAPGTVPYAAGAEETRSTVSGPGFGGTGGVGTGATPLADAHAGDGVDADDRRAGGPSEPAARSRSDAARSPISPPRVTTPEANDLSGAAGLVGATGVPAPGAAPADQGGGGTASAGTDMLTDPPSDRDVNDLARTDATDAAAPAAGLAGAASTDIAGVEGGRDNLKLIRGIGPRNEGRLNEIGVFRFEQIAAWTRRQQREIGEELAFPGRIERERWVAQAQTLAASATTGAPRQDGVRPVRADGDEPSVGLGARPPTLEAARDGKPDDLAAIDGVGDAIERKLFRLGIYHFDQVAAWSEEEAAWVSEHVGFPGRAERERWREAARVLVKGGPTEHAARVGRGRIRTTRPTNGGTG